MCRLWIAALIATAPAIGCLETATVRCGDKICPEGTVCVPTIGACADQERIDICRGRGDGESCSTSEIDGHCQSGVCVAPVCGDGIVSGPEECEGELGPEVTCADAGYYAGEISCGADCLFDTSQCSGTCGDGVVNGPETCDGDAIRGTPDCVALGFSAGRLGCSSICALDFDTCERFGFTPEISGTGFYIEAVFGPSPDRAFLVSTNYVAQGQGVVRELVDGLWRPVAIDGDWKGVHGSGPDDVWVVGQVFRTQSNSVGLAIRYDGVSWQSVDVGAVSRLYDLWVFAPDDAWIVGADGLLHWNGTTATPAAIGLPGDRLKGIWGAADDEIYVVGVRSGDPIAFAYDGSDWTELPQPPSPGQLRAAWSPGGGHLFAIQRAQGVGESAFDVWHWDGTSWSGTTLAGAFRCWDIWGRAVDDVYASCGGAGGDKRGVYHFDGVSWVRLDWEQDASARTLFGWDDQLLAAGARGALARLGGRAYLKHDLAVTEPTGVRDIDLTRRDHAVAVHGLVISTFDGQEWVDDTIANAAMSVYTAPNGESFVGTSGGQILRGATPTWTPEATPPELGAATVVAIDGASASEVWAASGPDLFRYNGVAWTHELDTPVAGVRFNDVSVASPTAAFATGAEYLVRWDGNTVEVDPDFPVSNGINGVWAASATAVYVATTRGLYELAGGVWQPAEGLPETRCADVSGSAADDIYAVFQSPLQTVYHFDGDGWTQVKPRSSVGKIAVAPGALMTQAGAKVELLVDL